MRKFVLYTLILAMIAVIGCGTKTDKEALLEFRSENIHSLDL